MKGNRKKKTNKKKKKDEYITEAIAMPQTKDIFEQYKTSSDKDLGVMTAFFVDEDDIAAIEKVTKGPNDPKYQELIARTHAKNIRCPLTEEEYEDGIIDFEILYNDIKSHVTIHPNTELKDILNDIRKYANIHKGKNMINGNVQIPLQWYRLHRKLANEVIERENRMAKPENKICGVCKIEAHNMCGKCKNIYYCSPQCQKIDWKIHKTICYSTSEPWGSHK